MEIASILISTKKLLGYEEAFTQFDPDMVIHINSALMNLTQLGVGPPDGFIIEDATAVWEDFLGDRKDLSGVKSYIYLKLRLIFDPPQTGVLIDAIKEQIQEFEWRLNIQV